MTFIHNRRARLTSPEELCPDLDEITALWQRLPRSTSDPMHNSTVNAILPQRLSQGQKDNVVFLLSVCMIPKARAISIKGGPSLTYPVL